jgi:hypothetical protein
MRDIF